MSSRQLRSIRFPRSCQRAAGPCLLVLCLAAATLIAQKSAPAVPRTGGSIGSGSSTAPSSGYPNFGDPPVSEQDQRLEMLRARGRELERQKRIVDDANRLVALTALYRARIGEHSSPTAEDARMLLDIEKLARSVKDRMRGM